MYSDISGLSRESILEFLEKYYWWSNHPYLMWMADDYNDVKSGDVYFIPDEENGGGKIWNSHKVQNPTIVLWYSYKLKSDYGEYIDGSPEGIAAEWMLHNTLYNGFYLPSKVGVFEGKLNQAAHTDIGKTVFHENRPLLIVPTLAIQYSMSKYSMVFDFCVYIRDGEQNE
jgi:hypothetical protein